MQTMEFQTAVNKQSTTPTRESDLIGIVNELCRRLEDATRKAAELGLSAEEIVGLKNRLRREAEVRWMRTRYATLDMSFTEGETNRRPVVIGRSQADPFEIEAKRWPAINSPSDHDPKKELLATLPVFVCEWGSFDRLHDNFTPDSSRTGYRSPFPAHHVRLGTLPAVRIAGVHYRARDVQGHVKMPDGITPALFAKIRRCIAFVELFDVMMLDRGIADVPERSRGGRNDGIEVGVLWAPVDEAWSFTSSPPRPAGDPAILVRHRSVCYLVGYFDTPDERPIDNLIREFSEGPLAAL